ncbi:MAG: GNAT family N-acetyltransferase [Clostridia bacterium]|nr:GNAT family N-acetyltransferase [Clostridia bacterium]
MRRFNIILVVDAAGENILMCRRVKPPYQGMYNLVGGKIEPGEDDLHAAYRELREETGVTAADVTIRHFVTFCYSEGCSGFPATELQAYVGRLRREVTLVEEKNPLLWMPLTEDFFDVDRFSGEGNIGHVLQSVQRYQPQLLEAREPSFTLAPLEEADLPLVAYYQRCDVESLRPMMAESAAQSHEGRYYEQFTIRVDGCIVGTASLYAHEDGTVSDGIEIYPPFRRCGFAAHALFLLADVARRCGYAALTAQVRTDNAASLALHRGSGFAEARTFVNRRGNKVCELVRALSVCHEMSLRPGPFAAIAEGRKRYELRLHDEKRCLIRVGDEIHFTRTTDGASIRTRVTSLHPFASFADLYAALPLTECGYTQESAATADPRDMEAYYPPEKQAQHGVLAISIKLIRLPIAALSGKLTVRELTQNDIPEMLRIARSNPLYYQHMRIQPTAENLVQAMQALPPRRTMADKHFFGWFDGGELVALMDIIIRHPEEDKAFIGWFIVDARRQGAGLGRALVADVLALLKAQGVQEVRLGRITGNPQSECFWQACGFADNGMSYDTEDYTVAVMAKRLMEKDGQA